MVLGEKEAGREGVLEDDPVDVAAEGAIPSHCTSCSSHSTFSSSSFNFTETRLPFRSKLSEPLSSFREASMWKKVASAVTPRSEVEDDGSCEEAEEESCDIIFGRFKSEVSITDTSNLLQLLLPLPFPLPPPLFVAVVVLGSNTVSNKNCVVYSCSFLAPSVTCRMVSNQF